MRIHDIHTSLPPNIDISGSYHPILMCSDELSAGPNTHDIIGNKKTIINCQGNKEIILSKSYSHSSFSNIPFIKRPLSFDSVESGLNRKDITLDGPQKLKSFNKNVKEINFQEIIQIFLASIKYAYSIIKTFLSTFNSRFLNFKKSYFFITFFFLLCLSLFFAKIGVEHFTNSGYQRLLSLESSGEAPLKVIKSAENNFFLASMLLAPFHFITNDEIKSTHAIISGGKQISSLAKDMLTFSYASEGLTENRGIKDIMFSQLIYNNKDVFRNYEDRIENIKQTFSQVQLGEKYAHINNKLEKFNDSLKRFEYHLRTFNNNTDNFLEILGHSKRKKYLIAFQNNDEIRPQGGFMGSLGLIEIFRGQIKDFTKNDVYFYEFAIKKETLEKQIAPEGIDRMTQYLGLRDSNYYINLKDSGEKIQYFMRGAGHDIDGIIYINQSSVFDLLNLTGEFYSETLQTNVSSENFSLLMSLLVEAKVSKEGTLGTPKKVLFDFIDEILEKIQIDNISQMKLANILWKNIQKREVIFYSFDKRHRELLKSVSLFQPINYGETLDFSYPVFTSISGNKSDRYIQRSFRKTISKSEACSFTTQLDITLKHKYSQKDSAEFNELFQKFSINPSERESLAQIQGQGTNKQYIRVIVPKDAIITQSNVGVIDYYDRGKSVDFYMNTPPGEESNFTLKYDIPNPDCKLYNYTFYKQPGIPYYDLFINSDGVMQNSIHQTGDTLFYQ